MMTKRLKLDSSSSSSSSSSSVHVHWDLIAIRILPKLPLESVARSKCVSKVWNFYFSSPEFNNMKDDVVSPIFRCYSKTKPIRELYYVLSSTHRRRNDRPSTSSTVRFIEVGPPKRRVEHAFNYLSAVGWHGGVTCLADAAKQYRFALWNPSSQESIFSNDFNNHGYQYGSYDNDEYFRCGFGYDSITGDHKIVKISYYDAAFGTLRAKVMLYSVKAGIWREISTGLPNDISTVKIGCWSSQALENGRRLHWLVNRNDGEPRRLILSFDESFRQITLP